MSRLECDSLLLTTFTTPGPGMSVALQVYVSERVAHSEEICNVLLYTPAESITGIVVLFPPGPPRFPVTTTLLSTTAGSSWMVQVRVRGSPWWRITVASGSRLIASVGGGTMRKINVYTSLQQVVQLHCTSLFTFHNEYLSSHIYPCSGGGLTGALSPVGYPHRVNFSVLVQITVEMLLVITSLFITNEREETVTA